MNKNCINRVIILLSTLVVLGMTGCGSSNESTNSTPNRTSTQVSGVAIDGILSGSTVCVDVNVNSACDINEDSNRTNISGEYTLFTEQKGPLFLFGGIDLGTGLPFTGTLKAPQGSSVITPLTSAIQALIESGLTKVEAERSIKAAMGIASDIRLTEFNPFVEITGKDAARAKVILEKQAAFQTMIHGAATTLATVDANKTVADTMNEVLNELSRNFKSATGEVDITAEKLETAIKEAAATLYAADAVSKKAVENVAQTTAASVHARAVITATNIKNSAVNNVTNIFNEGIKTANTQLQDLIKSTILELDYTKDDDENITGSEEENTTTVDPDYVETTANKFSYELQSYYADAIEKHGDDLKSALHTIVLNSAIFLTYAEDYQLLAKTDKDFSKPNEENVILFYLKESVTADSRCGSSGTNCWNREHMWPKSLGVGYDSLVNSYTDLHHLRASDAGINSSRGNKPYGEATTPYNKINGFYVDNKFEVSDNLKGDVARAILYMTVRYEGDNNEPDLEIYANDFSDTHPAELCTMLVWNHIDPVTSEDIKRNDIVQTYQGNRNPFVDNASWVDDIWGSECHIDINTTSSSASTGLIFSEYIEGSSNNKAVELYNAGETAITLKNYKIVRYSNGGTTGVDIPLDAYTLNAGSTFVIVNSIADSALLTYANQTSSAINYNGDDALTLVDEKGNVLDVIGQIGTKVVWGTGDVTTQNDTIRRKLTVTKGDTNSLDIFNPVVEWDGFAQDTYDGLGSR